MQTVCCSHWLLVVLSEHTQHQCKTTATPPVFTHHALTNAGPQAPSPVTSKIYAQRQSSDMRRPRSPNLPLSSSASPPSLHCQPPTLPPAIATPQSPLQTSPAANLSLPTSPLRGPSPRLMDTSHLHWTLTASGTGLHWASVRGA